MTGRAVCPVCGRDLALNINGTLRAHKASPGNREHCPGWERQGGIMVKQDDIIDAEVIDDVPAQDLAVRPAVELAIVEPAPWLVDKLLLEAAFEHRTEARILGALELVKKWYPEFARESGKWQTFEVENLGEDHRASLRTQFPATLDEQLEARFHEVAERIDRQALYYQGLP